MRIAAEIHHLYSNPLHLMLLFPQRLPHLMRDCCRDYRHLQFQLLHLMLCLPQRLPHLQFQPLHLMPPSRFGKFSSGGSSSGNSSTTSGVYAGVGAVAAAVAAVVMWRRRSLSLRSAAMAPDFPNVPT
ncbi:hypothetical protein BASA62_005743 [Batrachochytrium salamandrivorans]|nr:hypothetical protein BASA62_005743 [Batrachochytrium salamandrivorans]